MPASTDQSVGRVSELSLRFSYWYVTHKLQLRKAFAGLLCAISLGLYGYAGYQAYLAFFVHQDSYRQLLASLPASQINYSYYREAQQAKPLVIESFAITDGREGRFDFVAHISNPNSNFVAQDVTVQFLVGGQVIAETHGLVNPESEQYFLALGREVMGDAGSAIASVAAVDWQRYNGFASFAEPRLQFAITDVEFSAAGDLPLGGEIPVSALRFNIGNNSPFSYWQVGVPMVLYSGDQIVGVNYVTVDQLRAGQSRAVDVRWYETLPPVSNVVILPTVNILDSDSYMPVE